MACRLHNLIPTVQSSWDFIQAIKSVNYWLVHTTSYYWTEKFRLKKAGIKYYVYSADFHLSFAIYAEKIKFREIPWTSVFHFFAEFRILFRIPFLRGKN